MNNRTLKIVEGALMASIMVIFTIMDRYTLGMMVYFTFLLPLPMVYLSYKYGMKSSLVAYFGAIILTFLFTGLASTIVVGLEGLIGLVYGNGIKNYENISLLVLKNMAIGILMNFITIILFSKFFGYDIYKEMEEVKNFVGNFVDLSTIYNLDKLLLTSISLSVALMGIMEGYLTHLLSLLLLRRLNIKVNINRSFDKPRRIYGYIAFALTSISLFNLIRVDNEIITMIIQFIGTVSTLYLVYYGYRTVKLWLAKSTKLSKPLIQLVSIMFLLFFNLTLMVLGFLYITTSLKDRL